MFSRLRHFFKKSKHENDTENKSKIDNENGNEALRSGSVSTERQKANDTGLPHNGSQCVEVLKNSTNIQDGHQNGNISNDHRPNNDHTVSVSYNEFNDSTITTPKKLLLTTELDSFKVSNLNSVTSVAAEDVNIEIATPNSKTTPTSLEERIAYDANNTTKESDTKTTSSPLPLSTTAPTSVKKETIIINPTGNNNIACEAISQKLNDIAAVAGSLDAAIRDVQNGVDVLESNSSTSSSDKKAPNTSGGSSSGEDWHSRSTEDDSFATASEGNFTPHSHSSSFQTASGHTSLLLSSSTKNSFDASEADDSTLSAFDLPELMMSPNNTSFDSSDHSFLSAKQDTLSSSPATETRTPTTSNIEINNNNNNNKDDENNSIADVEEIHSQSVTPTPGDAHFQSIPVESETELDSYIADAPSFEILTEETPAPLNSVTPEVSQCSANTNLSYKQQHSQSQSQSLPQQQQQQLQQRDTNNANKTNAAWRRSKYYENITKQTIRGFL